ncbi:hypothetical protein ACUL41_17100 [Virgibacillus natechei]
MGSDKFALVNIRDIAEVTAKALKGGDHSSKGNASLYASIKNRY